MTVKVNVVPTANNLVRFHGQGLHCRCGQRGEQAKVVVYKERYIALRIRKAFNGKCVHRLFLVQMLSSCLE